MNRQDRVRVTYCAEGLLFHSIGLRHNNESNCCNWCYKPLKYSTQHLCSSCKNRNRLGTLYTPYRGISNLKHLTARIKQYNSPMLQKQIHQILLKTCEQSNFFRTNYYEYWKSKPENKGNFTKLYRITQICLAYTLDWIEEPQHYNHKIEIYYRFLTQAVTRAMSYDRKYYSALPVTISNFIGYNIIKISLKSLL